jgi:LytS/YehU family sensor histidine kinase
MLSHRQFLYTYIIIVIVLGVAMTMVLATRFFHNWRHSFMEVEQLKREKMKSDYLALQNQLNPHFLFNNFNMLVSEIRRDPANAVRITERLSDVYRYVLESKNHETVRLAEEVEFVQAIIFLHEVRFGDNLVVEFGLSEEVMEYRLPPLTLQILLENALKHNVISAVYRLRIDIEVEEDYLVVTNNVKPRKSTYSTGMGLENIKMRYSYLTERKVTVEADEQRFKVKVPLLKEI